MDKQKEIERIAEIICEAYIPKQKPQELRYADIYRFMPTATALVNAGYRLCGGESCPNFKHYQAECERCTKKMEIKKALEIDAIKHPVVKEFAERLKECFVMADDIALYPHYSDGYNRALEAVSEKINELVKEVCGE